MDYESMAAAGTMLGCGSVIVMDDTTDIVKQVRRMVDFYAHESCGQCTPCREGTAWAAKILRRIENGWGTEEDLDTLLDISDNMTGKTICVLSDAAAAPIVSSIQKFRDDYLALIRAGKARGAAPRSGARAARDADGDQCVRHSRRSRRLERQMDSNRTELWPGSETPETVTCTIDGIEVRCPRGRG
jgi:hypothetical protein